ncbi:peroxisomal membrane protein PEX14-like isoform X1 [Olea europaea var. sylvestris]|uniref:peroxisomal membrane protein PEX14-like isoform X1 n=1 Tax=Olea europaea var. sylvestris TaxID=158386 RepID=UPI000C1D029E|nr:peroxisomal membrane protein PEX14-like isoform X1 [Olea europaea var. sylvestris]
MGSQSDSPPDSVVEKPQNPVSQVTQAAVDDHQNAKAEAAKESSPPSVFVNSEPIREDQVQNAVKFLSHPKVRGSPVIYRRSFLERKGLTKEEIDEAFRRVPDPTPSVTASESVVPNQADGQLKSSSNIQSQSPTQTLRPGPVSPAGSISKMGTFSRFHWSHALLAVGFLAVSGAGTAVLFKNSIIPRLKAWVRKVVLEEEEGEEVLLKENNSKTSLAEEAAAAAKAAAAAASDVARTSQEMLMSKTEEKRCFEELINMLNAQVREMKSMSNAIQKLEGQSNIHGRIPVEGDDYRISQRSLRVPYANGKINDYPQSEIMPMIQRGEKPSNITEINYAPPNPNQPVPNPRLVPTAKPWEVGQARNSSSNVLQSQGSNDVLYHESQDNQSIAENTVPWWERKNARITEIEAVDEHRFGSSNVVSNGRPVPRSWVPPQPPPVAMQEAAAAIRQPKKTFSSSEQLTDNQLLARSSDVPDELQSITRISESGGIVEANGGSLGLNSSEIQREEDNSYFET